MEELKIEYLPVDALHPAERNARAHGEKDVAAIAASIEEFGFNDPLGIWGGGGTIVEGHGRLLAAKKLGMTVVPCIRLDHMTDAQRRAYALAHNKTAELSEWDFSALEAEMAELSGDFDLGAFGFDVDAEPAVREDDYTPVIAEEPKARRGDLWLLGRHRLLCGDATSAADVARLMNGRRADMLLTDPPYNVDVSEKAGKIMNDNMGDEEFRRFLAAAFRAAKTAMRPGAAFHIWHANTEGYNAIGAIRDAGLTLRQVLIWVKKSPTLGRQDFQWQHEPCAAGEVLEDDTEAVDAALYGWVDGRHSWFKKRREKTVLYFDKPRASKEHPTMKPVLMFDYEMQCNTQRGDAVLDPFAGSGTTLIAAEQNGRDAFLLELDPRFCDVIVDRWEKLTGEKAVLIGGGDAAGGEI